MVAIATLLPGMPRMYLMTGMVLSVWTMLATVALTCCVPGDRRTCPNDCQPLLLNNNSNVLICKVHHILCTRASWCRQFPQGCCQGGLLLH